jgi:uracil-DNA glycosylase family 4
MKTGGLGRKKIFVLAEAPGRKEDEQGTQLVGNTGLEFRKSLRRFGINLEQDCWRLNAVNCRPPENRTPKPIEIEACRPLVLRAIRETLPRMILVIGKAAVTSLFGEDWPIDIIGKWVKWRIPYQDLNAWICPTRSFQADRTPLVRRARLSERGNDSRKSVGSCQSTQAMFERTPLRNLIRL